MSLDNFIPTAWTSRLLQNLNDAHVYGQCVNRDYEGEIREAGDTVKIQSIGRVAIVPYTKNVTTLTPETLQDAGLMLAVTESKAFCFEIDDVDAAQQKPKVMSEAMREAAWGLRDVADDFLATTLAAGVAAGNILSAVTVGVGAADDDAYEALVDLDVKLSENNVPREGRWVVVPPWYEGLLRKDPRFVSFGTDPNRGLLVGGKAIGGASGFQVYLSNNVPVSGSAYTVIGGYKGAATYAEQVNKVEAFRPEGAFSDAVKGLHLYGAKVTRPYALAKVAATAA